jgi:hypothetical protein
MDLLGKLTKDHCEADKIFFDRDDVIAFVVQDFKYDEKTRHIFINTVIDSGIHQGKDYTIFVNGSDNPVAEKLKAQFFYKSGFWTEEELSRRDIKLARMIGRRLQGKASKVTLKGDQKYQSIIDIKDLGPAGSREEHRSTTVNTLADVRF